MPDWIVASLEGEAGGGGGRGGIFMHPAGRARVAGVPQHSSDSSYARARPMQIVAGANQQPEVGLSMAAEGATAGQRDSRGVRLPCWDYLNCRKTRATQAAVCGPYQC